MLIKTLQIKKCRDDTGFLASETVEMAYAVWYRAKNWFYRQRWKAAW